MGLKYNTQSSGPSSNVHYSGFLGMLHEANEENNKAMLEMRALITDAEVRKGFTGNSGNTAKGRAFLKEKGVTAITEVSGKLSSAYLRDVPITGGTSTYLNVVIRDDDGTYYVSAPLASSGTQMLIRKLVNAKIGGQTELNLFATVDKSDDVKYAGRTFVSHGASLKQDGKQIPVIDSDDLKANIEKSVNALKNAGMDDSKVLSAARNKIASEYHANLMKAFEGKTDAFYADSKIEKPHVEADKPATTAATARINPVVEFENFEDDIPF